MSTYCSENFDIPRVSPATSTMTQLPLSTYWTIWQQHHPYEFPVYEAPFCEPHIPYGDTTAQIHTPMVVEPYVIAGYSPHNSLLSSTPTVYPIKQEFGVDSSSAVSLDQSTKATHISADRGKPRQTSDTRLQSPTGSEFKDSGASSETFNSTARGQTVINSESINGLDRVGSKTDVDELMTAIDAVGDLKSKKKWICDRAGCNKRYRRRCDLDVHRRIHTGYKPFICDNCDKGFSRYLHLTEHIRVHTGEKPYLCRVCRIAFSSNGNRRTHEKRHEGLKPFTCELDGCYTKFAARSDMKRHQNKFHLKTLRVLTGIVIRCATSDDVPNEHRQQFEYFKEQYKISNKPPLSSGRLARACMSCRSRKIKCGADVPCSACVRSGIPCTYPESQKSDPKPSHGQGPSTTVSDCYQDELLHRSQLVKPSS